VLFPLFWTPSELRYNCRTTQCTTPKCAALSVSICVHLCNTTQIKIPVILLGLRPRALPAIPGDVLLFSSHQHPQVPARPTFLPIDDFCLALNYPWIFFCFPGLCSSLVIGKICLIGLTCVYISLLHCYQTFLVYESSPNWIWSSPGQELPMGLAHTSAYNKGPGEHIRNEFWCWMNQRGRNTMQTVRSRQRLLFILLHTHAVIFYC
jgi:hypothetical protein